MLFVCFSKYENEAPCFKFYVHFFKLLALSNPMYKNSTKRQKYRDYYTVTVKNMFYYFTSTVRYTYSYWNPLLKDSHYSG